MKALVTKVKQDDSVYDFVKHKGHLPKYVIEDIYSYKRASVLCSQFTWEFAFQENPSKLNTRTFHKSDHILYQANTGDAQIFHIFL